MQLYRKIIPKIAKDIIHALNVKGLIEVEPELKGEAELDLAAVMVEQLDVEDEIDSQARDMLAKRNLGQDKLKQAKESLAKARNVKIGDEGTEYIFEQLIEALFASKNISEIYSEDVELRKEIKLIADKYLSIPKELDQEARSRLKNLKEGTLQWDIEYPRIISQLKRQKGLV